MKEEKLNVFDFFNKKATSDRSLTIMAITLLPALFIVKSLESALVYTLLLAIYFVLAVLLQTVIKKYLPKETKELANIIGLVALVTFIKLLSDAFLYTFSNNHGIYIYLMILNPLPLMAFKDEENRLSNNLVEALKKILNIGLMLLSLGLVREVFGSATLSFGQYLTFVPKVNISLGFENYAISSLLSPFGAMILLAFALVIIRQTSKDVEVLP